ncbi:carboxylating nicotinate-nucleotide diphosphorylase [Hippea jasoniae]|uniref:carboxylating nicotinate-nucleotide diphosphorylase n=1 Tax=Hippea jasoniae TaxID=944479 RepID=UPI00054D408F|nr:carboxylating nicotinate-nucleotide diphosphorylase [Hippea jasoniae]
MNPVYLKKVFEYLLLEDAFYSDITTDSIATDKTARAIVKAKEDFVVAGLIFIKPLFETVCDNFEIELLKKDGDIVKKSHQLAIIKASDRCLLYVERALLNLLQRLSGIATKTKKIATLIEPYKTKITDTRKTTPGLRFFEKYAVKVGCGTNHRMGLFDAVLIKDNHIKAAGSIRKAVELVRKNISFTTKIEVECANIDMVKEALDSKVDIVMLDNMKPEEIKTVIETFKNQALFEASGNIDENNITDYAQTGVDFISLGAITHHACWVDINMKFVE